MTEQEITFTNDSLTLAGTLVLPEGAGPWPAVVMIPGSGPVDRNENHKKAALNVFNEFAGRLAEQGFASLRYDKRGVGASQGEYYTAGFHDNAADARAAYEWVCERPDINKSAVYLLGHSEGAYIAIRLAGEGLESAGVILLAGGARTGETELVWQAEQVIKGLKGFQKWLITTLHIDAAKQQRKTLEKIKQSTKDTYRVQLISKLNAKWMREFLAYNPAEDLADITAPVLAITGGKDIQVDPANIELMGNLVKGPYEPCLLPDVTHLLRAEAGEAGLATYKAQLTRPVDERITGKVLAWLAEQAKR